MSNFHNYVSITIANIKITYQFSSVAQSCPTLCNPMNCMQHARPPCPSPTPGVHPNSCPGGSDGKASAYNAGDLGSIPGLGRSPGEGNGDLLQYSCPPSPAPPQKWLNDHLYHPPNSLVPFYSQPISLTTSSGQPLIRFVSHLYQFRSVAQSCPTLCDLVDCCMPGLPVHPKHPEFTQTHVH